MTKEPWGKCWEMGIYEFLNYLSYSREYNRKQMELQKKAVQQYKRR